VNELLTQMESFDGLFTCATNFLDHLDPAALRRFGLKLEFWVLRAEQAVSLFFARYARITGRKLNDADRVFIDANLVPLALLTPGDFATAAGRCELLGHSSSLVEFLERLNAP
jgi:transitional endoplasmic reticulum ATPase